MRESNAQFYADTKSDIRFDNRFDIRLWNSFHVKLYHKSYVCNKIYGMINIEAIPKFDTKSVIKFDISTKPTTWIGH